MEPIKQIKIARLKSAITDVHLKRASTQAPMNRPMTRRTKKMDVAYATTKRKEPEYPSNSVGIQTYIAHSDATYKKIPREKPSA